LDAGFTVPLFNCNPPEHLKDGYREDLFPVVNSGSNPDACFKKLREILPKGPLMCGEFYPGWFDTWGQPHHTGKTQQYLKDLEEMLQSGASFSIYMVHGGTTFGLWSGADRPFKPDTSSYDYDAPISEAGWPTEKFFQTRALFAKFLMPGESIPEPPGRNALITFPAVRVEDCAPVLLNLPKPKKDSAPGTMEQYDQGYGCILYRTQVPAGPAGTFEADSVHDIGLVFMNGQRIGFLDRRNSSFKVGLPARTKNSTLDVLVEAMGRVNFGKEVHDRKGLQGPVKIILADGQTVKPASWEIYNLPLDKGMLGQLRYHKSSNPGPAFWRAEVSIPMPGDTFLDLSSWGKGVAWVNGHCLGRFWNIGPTQTMYAPGPWLKAGRNEIVILDLVGPSDPVIAGQAEPVLDKLRPELDFSKR
jgi:beta-galactosidase